jgi:hypothetical protein
MTVRTLAKIIVNCYDYKTVEEFDRIINHLTIVYYHTDDDKLAEDIQKTIFYLMDKRRERT